MLKYRGKWCGTACVQSAGAHRVPGQAGEADHLPQGEQTVLKLSRKSASATTSSDCGRPTPLSVPDPIAVELSSQPMRHRGTSPHASVACRWPSLAQR